MSRPENPIICDGCGTQKGPSNHWWIIASPVPIRPLQSIYLFQGNADESGLDESWQYYDACGQNCALKVVSEQMGKQAQA